MRQCVGRASTCASTTLIHNPSSARHLVSRSPTTSRGCMFDTKKASNLMQEIDMDEQHPSLPRQLSLLWFSRDLRVGDNAALQAASASPASGPSYLVPVYILSPRDHLQPRRSLHDGGTGVPKLGPHRARFLVECLSALRQELRQQYSSDLIYRCGEPHIELSLLVRQILQCSPQASCRTDQTLAILLLSRVVLLQLSSLDCAMMHQLSLSISIESTHGCRKGATVRGS